MVKGNEQFNIKTCCDIKYAFSALQNMLAIKKIEIQRDVYVERKKDVKNLRYEFLFF